MRQNFLSIPFTPIVNLFNIVTFFLLAKRVLCTDSQYLACNPKSCGDGQIITFPFYIKNQQESFCGYPGFELSCNKNSQPVLQLPDNNDYIIQEIFYSNQSFRVSNAAFLDNKNSTITATTCVPQIQKNMSFPEDRLKLSPNQTELLLIYNCNSSTLANDTELSKHKIIDCVGRSETGDSGIAMLEDDPLVGYASEKCRKLVVAPVALDSYRKERNVSIGRTLENGFLLDWIASDCSFCSQSGGRCGFDSGSYHFKCFCPDRPHGAGCISDCGECTASGGYCVFEEENGVCYCPDGTLRKHCNDGEGGNNTAKWLILAASVVGVGILIIAVYYCCARRLSSYKSKDDNSIEAFLKDNGSLAPKRYGYSEVKKMTQSFKDKLGQGGYGSVFKGKLPDGCLVAVKVLTNSKGNGAEFINEVASISRTSHVNIVTLLGFCFDGSKRILIYEFMPNGSLEKYIYKENAAIAGYQLDCEKLYQIALGVARGLEYLHRGCNTRILHFDIKPQNILLDENFCPKISDFGLAKICHKRESKISMMDARGTIGYIAPEVFCRNFGAVSHKSDVYSYGMLVLEIIGGRQNPNVVTNDTSEMYFPEWIHKRLELGEELGLPGINSEEENNVARKMVLVSLWCIQTDPSNRPPVNGVVEMLQASLESLPIPPRPYLLSPATVPEISLASSQILSSELLEFQGG